MAWGGTTLAWADTAEDAETYLKTNYVDGTITNDTVVAKEDDLVYAVSAKTTSGYERTSLTLRKVKSTQYKVWYSIEKNDYEISIKRQTAENCTLSVKVPEKMFTLMVTLSVYAQNVSDADIQGKKATPLATQKFTLKFAAKPKSYQVKIEPIDSENRSKIEPAKVTLYKTYSWKDSMDPTNGSYTLEEGTTYKVDVEAEGYQSIKEQEITPTSNETIQIPMKKKAFSTIRFSVKDKQGSTITAPTVTVKKGYYDTIKAETDGSYRLENGVKYDYTVTAVNYTTKNSSITPNGDQTIAVTLEKDIRSYKVKFVPVSAADNNTEIQNVTVSVKHIEYDDYDEEEVETPVVADSDGMYTLSKGESYTITASKEGYKTATKSNYQPSGESETYTERIPMSVALPVAADDQKKVDAAKTAFDQILGALRPVNGTDTNVESVVLRAVQNQKASLALDGISVKVASSDKPERIASDGIIHYVNTDTLNTYGNNFVNVSCAFQLVCGNAEATTQTKTVTVGWDRSHVQSKMNSEATALDENRIKGENASLSAVDKNLILPQILSSSARTAWSKITWESSNPAVIAIESTGYDALTDAKAGKITPAASDQNVTLTATFAVNDNIINKNVEKESDFTTFKKKFEVTVKGTGATKPTEESLQALLDQYYTADSLSDATTKEKLDTNNCMGDIQLPRYTRIQNQEGESVFKNKEITVTSDNEKVVKINGYRANVDVFQPQDTVVNLVITFTRDGVSVRKEIPITVRAISEAALDAEIELMAYAKAHYFDGINDGAYKDAAHVTGNLHAFREFYFDQNRKPVWVYDIKNETGKGIFPDDFFTDTWEMEGAGYNKFQSSNPQIIRHDNLLVNRDTMPQKVTITSLLSSQRYGAFAKKHPNNEKLQKLYQQKVSATIIVQGTDSGKTALAAKISTAKSFLQAIEEGTSPGQYPAGTKKKLGDAIAEAEKYINSETATEQELTQAVLALDAVVENCAKSRIEDRNPFAVTISVRGSGNFKNIHTQKTNVAPKTDVWSVVKSVLDDQGYRYEAETKGTVVYLKSVTDTAGNKLAALDTPNSGWLYKVNGVLPDVYMSQYKLGGNESIELYYTADWVKDPAAGAWADKKSDVTTSGASGSATTTAPTDVKVSEKTNADGTKETGAEVKVDSKHHDEIIKQAAEKKSAEIVLEVSKADSKGADNVQLTLDVTFVKNVADKTNADLTVNTENGKVTLDQETIKTVLGATKGATITLEISKVAKPTEAQKKAAGANGHVIRLVIKSGNQIISDFNKGKATVMVELVSRLIGKKVAAIHIADDGTIEQLAGKVLTVGGKQYYEFATPHFSTFAIVDADEVGLDAAEEPAVDAKALASKLTPAARSAKTAKKNVKVTTSLDKQDKEIISQLKDAGYTVKYRFYRSTKKAAGYKAAVTKKASTYTNTSGKKGTKYFYKVQVRVYDASGKLAAKTALKQCRCASRTWNK